MPAGQIRILSHHGREWRGHGRRRRFGLAPVIAASLALIAGCTATGSPAQPTSVASSVPSPTGASVATSPAAQPGQLSCADAYTRDPIGALPAFTASGVGFESLSEKGVDPIPADNTGLSSEASGYFLKSPVYLDKSVAWAEVAAIEGDITFLWVPAQVWTGPPGWSVSSYESRTVRFESCMDSYTGFLGGVRTSTARECATLGLRSSIHPQAVSIRVAIGKGACD